MYKSVTFVGTTVTKRFFLTYLLKNILLLYRYIDIASNTHDKHKYQIRYALTFVLSHFYLNFLVYFIEISHLIFFDFFLPFVCPIVNVFFLIYLHDYFHTVNYLFISTTSQ